MGVVYFKSRDEGDGTYDGQIGHAYLHLDDDAPESEGRELGFITLAEAAEIARQHEVDLEWTARRARTGRTRPNPRARS
jgi:hypothetical protein